MKKIFTLIVVALFTVNFASSQVTVTFKVDMNGATGFDAGTHEVYMSGSNSTQTAGIGTFASWPQPGSVAGLKLTDANSDGNYELAISGITAGDYIFKFFYIVTGTPSWNNGEWPGDPNRALTVGSVNISASCVWANQDAPVIAGIDGINSSVLIYPNPSTGLFQVNADKNYSLEVVDITGKVVLTQEIGRQSNVVDLTNCNSGMYFFYLNSGEAKKVYKVVVK